MINVNLFFFKLVFSPSVLELCHPSLWEKESKTYRFFCFCGFYGCQFGTSAQFPENITLLLSGWVYKGKRSEKREKGLSWVYKYNTVRKNRHPFPSSPSFCPLAWQFPRESNDHYPASCHIDTSERKLCKIACISNAETSISVWNWNPNVITCLCLKYQTLVLQKTLTMISNSKESTSKMQNSWRQKSHIQTQVRDVKVKGRAQKKCY